MAKPSRTLINALRETAERLALGDDYSWSHMGACNCGHLAQTVTKLSKAEIHAYAMEKYGDWADKAIDYCPQSHFPIDHVLTCLFELGLNRRDVANLERLADPEIMRLLPDEIRYLDKRNRHDVVLYLQTWANLLETQLSPHTVEPCLMGKSRPLEIPAEDRVPISARIG